ncbi:vWA domain-containing protein [Nocardiopsis potens]|uniref:vWA domain-containing protein n=1 Tax=Nocardiopsis potens TaxID=1246458 RepID=UPI000347A143|nr:VWA domain-containing protein [Nocardiopsis potens]
MNGAPVLGPGGAATAIAGFARALRAAGVPADTARTAAFAEALTAVDPVRARDVYWAGRLTLCSGPDDLAPYDACFAAYFGGARPAGGRRRPPPGPPRTPPWAPEGGEEAAAGPDGPLHPVAADRTEVLRRADIGQLSAAERAEVARLVSLIRTGRPRRRTRRRAPAARGALDPRRTLAAAARTDGEPIRLRYRDRAERPRRVVLLVDVSGSMSPYAESLLRFAHALVRGHPAGTEVFSIGTRLTRITRELRTADPGRALRAAGAAVPDWRGGTRLGTELKRFLDVHGGRGMARGAVAVIASDGWERGDAALLGAATARLSRLAHRVVWVNPHKAQPGYRPLAAGMAAALPHVDDFVSGHSLEALEHLAAAIAGGPLEGGGARA